MSWQRGGVRRSSRRSSLPCRCRSSGCSLAVPCLLPVPPCSSAWVLASSLDTVVVVVPAALFVFDGVQESEDPRAKPRSAF